MQCIAAREGFTFEIVSYSQGMGDAFVIYESTTQPCKNSYSKEKEECASLIVCVRVLLLIHCQRTLPMNETDTEYLYIGEQQSLGQHCIYRRRLDEELVLIRLRVLLVTQILCWPKNWIPRSNINIKFTSTCILIKIIKSRFYPTWL